MRTFADHSRNTLDLSIVPAIQRESHLPIMVDPSHGTGKRNKVIPLSRAAVAVGCDGLMLEVHDNPEQARSDGAQSIFPAQLEELLRQVRPIAEVLERTFAAAPQPPRDTAGPARRDARHSVARYGGAVAHQDDEPASPR